MASIEEAVTALNNGEVIAYPTEGVFGLGCDPDNTDAIQKLLDIKQRPVEKGLILIAASLDQLQPYIDLSLLTPSQKKEIEASWPGPVTWVVPKGIRATTFITGHFDSVAVRVSDHPDVRRLCGAFGKPLISTSANLAGMPACKSKKEVLSALAERVLIVLDGKTGRLKGPTKIREAISGKYLRN